jgi:hypothetical protein
MISVHENLCRRRAACGDPRDRFPHTRAFGTLSVEAAIRCYGGGSSSSTTSPTTTNEEVALQTGAGAGVAVGAGASTGAINITPGDVATSEAAMVLNAEIAAGAVGTVGGVANRALDTVGGFANRALDTVGGVAGAALDTVGGVAGSALVAEDHAVDLATGAIEHESDTVGTVATTAINTNALLAGSVINAGQNIGLASLQFAQNQSELNYNALNQNTALAFSTIDHLISGQTAGQLEAAAQALTAATTPASTTAAQPTIIYAGSTQQPTTVSGTSKMSTGEWIGLAIVAAVVIYAVTKKK